jgi:predicted transposase YbfD/YdcC
MVHSQPELEPEITEVITRLSPKYHEDDPVDATEDTDNLFKGNQERNDANQPDVDLSMLNNNQMAVLEQCTRYFQVGSTKE